MGAAAARARNKALAEQLSAWASLAHLESGVGFVPRFLHKTQAPCVDPPWQCLRQSSDVGGRRTPRPTESPPPASGNLAFRAAIRELPGSKLRNLPATFASNLRSIRRPSRRGIQRFLHWALAPRWGWPPGSPRIVF